MLNDLDARRSNQVADKVNLQWMKGQPVRSQWRRYLPWLWLLLVLLFVAVALQWWRLNNTNDIAALNYLTESEPAAGDATKNGESNSANKSAVDAPVHKSPAEKNLVAVVQTPLPIVASEQTVVSQKRDVVTAIKATKAKPLTAKVSVVTAEPSSMPAIKQNRPLTPQQKELEHLAKVENLLQQMQLLEAEQLLSNFVEQNPLALRSGEKLVSLWLAQQQYGKAQQLLGSLRTAYPHDIGLIKHQSRLLLLTGDTEKSVLLLMSEQPLLASNSDYYELLGLAARKNQQLELSEQVYRGLLDYDPSRGDWWMGLAIAIDLQAKPAARQAYQQAINSRHLSAALRDYARQRLAVL
jgi:MSHA biogenesis protein MshN